jgi:hypothetical protein
MRVDDQAQALAEDRVIVGDEHSDVTHDARAPAEPCAG